VERDQKHWYRRRSTISGVAAGLLYGITLRFLFGIHFETATTGWLMTITYLVLVPGVIGLITVSEAEAERRTPVIYWTFAPWLPTLLACCLAILFRWEGLICIIMAIPITFIAASIGGITAGIYSRRVRAASRSTLACFAMLPLLLAPLESQFSAPLQTRTVTSAIRIHARASTIWHNIERVPPISPTELSSTWTHRIGFPRPVEATLSFEGPGGVRHATFEHGLLFIETITDWEPEHRLAFSIRADSAHIPTTTLDEHVTIGGPYFDVLDGEYRLEPLPNGDTILHLTSHQRLSTDLNGYAGLWTDAVMQNLQTGILQVIQHRCEHTL
jgi:hypothetical protein